MALGVVTLEERGLDQARDVHITHIAILVATSA